MLSKLKHELKTIFIVTLYFLCCFWLIVLLRSLFLEEYGFDIYGYSAAAIGALVIAKVVVIVDAFGLGERFKETYRLLHIFAQSLTYTLCAFIIVVIEHLVRSAFSKSGFAKSFFEELASLDWHLVAAKIICVSVSFIVFFILKDVNKTLEPGGLKEFFLKERTEGK